MSEGKRRWAGFGKPKLLLSRGRGNGFITLTENTEAFYKVNNYYSP